MWKMVSFHALRIVENLLYVFVSDDVEVSNGEPDVN
jgi:hypothetical protein